MDIFYSFHNFVIGDHKYVFICQRLGEEQFHILIIDISGRDHVKKCERPGEEQVHSFDLTIKACEQLICSYILRTYGFCNLPKTQKKKKIGVVFINFPLLVEFACLPLPVQLVMYTNLPIPLFWFWFCMPYFLFKQTCK